MENHERDYVDVGVTNITVGHLLFVLLNVMI